MVNMLTGLLSFLCVCFVTLIAESAKYPVLLVPGDGGSQLWHKEDANENFASLWLYPHDILFHFDTFLKRLQLTFDNRTGRTDDGPNRTIQACGFGDPNVLTSLVSTWNIFSKPHQTQEECDGKVAARFTEEDFEFDTFLKSVTELVELDKVSMAQLELAAHSLQAAHNLQSGPKCASAKLPVGEHCGPAQQERAPGWNDELGTPQDTIVGPCQGTTDNDTDRKQCVLIKILQYLLSIWHNLRDLKYYKAVVKRLQKQGYTVNKDIRGAPYDFRKAPNELQDYYSNLTKLIEATSATNDDSPVVVVAHSYGNPVMLYFYNSVTTQAWRDRYIRAHVALSPPWAGAVKIVKLITSGENFHLPFVSPTKCRTAQRSWPSSIWLMPCVLCKVWDPTQPIVVTATRNYTVTDYQQLFEDLNFTQGYDMWGWLQRNASVSSAELPKIGEFHVLYGTDVPTPSQLVFSPGTFPDGEPTIQNNGHGDGTVNLRSMEVFKHVAPPSNMIMKHKPFSGVDHMGILNDQRVLDHLMMLVTSDRHG